MEDENQYQMTLGETIRYWRGRRGLSRADLARKARLKYLQIAFLENGKDNRSMTLWRAARIAGALDIPVAILAEVDMRQHEDKLEPEYIPKTQTIYVRKDDNE